MFVQRLHWCRSRGNRFPDLAVICMDLVNGSVGYLAPADLYDLDAYPVWQTPFDQGCLERVGETMTGAIEFLHG